LRDSLSAHDSLLKERRWGIKKLAKDFAKQYLEDKEKGVLKIGFSPGRSFGMVRVVDLEMETKLQYIGGNPTRKWIKLVFIVLSHLIFCHWVWNG
jgi:hypothetical protein